MHLDGKRVKPFQAEGSEQPQPAAQVLRWGSLLHAALPSGERAQYHTDSKTIAMVWRPGRGRVMATDKRASSSLTRVSADCACTILFAGQATRAALRPVPSPHHGTTAALAALKSMQSETLPPGLPAGLLWRGQPITTYLYATGSNAVRRSVAACATLTMRTLRSLQFRGGELHGWHCTGMGPHRSSRCSDQRTRPSGSVP